MKIPFLNFLKRAASCRRGMAATEFALLLPIQVLLFFGVIEASDALTANRRVALASNTLADLVAQSKELTFADVDSLFVGIREIIDPTAASSLSVNLVSVVQDAGGSPIVHWSRDIDGTAPYTPGSRFPNLTDATILSAGSSLVFVELTYDYQPTLTYRFFSTPMIFTRHTTRWPRLTTRVQLCTSPGVGCTM